jgi:SAM-dependent methyltransferase
MDNEAMLERFHDRHAGASDRVFGPAAAADGRSSYHHLAEYVPDGARDVLDLACGDGALLEVLLARHRRAVGLDRNRAELAAAGRRLPDAELHHGIAEALPFADGRFDAVVCHMALMLMDDAGVVVAEVRRVLRPGGRFAAAVGAVGARSDGMRRVLEILHGLPGWAERQRVRVDPRTGDEGGLRSLLAPPMWRGVSVRQLEVTQDVDAAELPAFLQQMYYDVDALPEADRAALAERLAVAVSGPVRWTTGMLLVAAEAA